LGLILAVLFSSACSEPGIDREALVKRHIPTLSEVDTLSPFTVGNGEFAFMADVTGLQTFPEYYEEGIHLGNQSQWGWHSVPNDQNYRLEDAFEHFDTHGREVPYASKQRSDAGEWLRSNPHRLHLGTIGFDITKSSQDKIQPSDVHDIEQVADIWEGIISSRFRVEGHPIAVETACHPRKDLIAVRTVLQVPFANESSSQNNSS
jgi:hypothetical protein